VFSQRWRKVVWRSRSFWGTFFALLFAILLFNGLFIYRSWSQLQAERTLQARLLVQTLVESLPQGPADDHETIRTKLQGLAFGSIHYAQFVHQGEVHVDLRSSDAAELKLEPLEFAQSQARQLWIGGLPILDIIAPLPASQGYVRLGFSLMEAAWIVAREAILMFTISLAIVLGLSALFGGWLVLRSGQQIESQPSFASEAPTPIAPSILMQRQTVMHLNGFHIDDAGKRVSTEDGRSITLPPKEYALLRLLVSQPGRVFSEEEIRHELWPEDAFMTRKDATHYVYLLRKRLKEHGFSPTLIENVRGYGYKISI